MLEGRDDSAPIHKVSSLNGNARLIIVKIRIGELEASAVVDTGATISILPGQGIIISLCKPELNREKIKVQAFDDSLLDVGHSAIIEVRPAAIEMDPVRIKTLVIGNRSEVIGYDMILGLPGIKELGLLISHVDGAFVVTRNKVEVGREEEPPATSRVVGVAAEISRSNIDPYFEERQGVLLLARQHSDTFAETITTHVSCEPMKINLRSFRRPQAKLKRYSPAEIVEMRRMVNKLLDAGIVEPSNSSMSANARMIPKKNGSMRLVINYIPLNRITIPDRFPLPHLESLFLCLKSAKFFTSMDCTDGFFQIPLDTADHYKTAFITPDGLYQFTRCPQGLTNSPSVYQRMMNLIFAEGLYKCCIIYVDDILVFAPTIEEHNARLAWVLERCRATNIKLKLSKCKFLQTEIEFLGFKISHNSISPVKGKTDPIYSIIPTNKTDVQTILGTLNYYSRFIHGFAELTEPLRALVKNDSTLRWGSDQKRALEEIRRRLEAASPQVIPDTESPKIVELVVHPRSVEVTCLNNNYQLISRAGHVLTTTESNYTDVEKNLLAMILAHNKFGIYLPNGKTRYVTSSANLKKVMKLMEFPLRIERLLVKLPPDLDMQLVERKPESISGLATSDSPPQEIFSTDGACCGNGTNHCQASWALVATYNRELSRSGILKDPKPTNQKAEIQAAIEAMKTAISNSLSNIVIRSDSKYVVDAMNEWFESWESNGYKGRRNKDVVNIEPLKQLANLRKQLNVKFIHVNGHSGDEGNEEADALAKETLEAHLHKIGFARPITIIPQDYDEEYAKFEMIARSNTNSNYKLINDQLYYCDPKRDEQDQLRLFLPSSKRPQALYTAHDDQMYGGHSGTKKTKNKLRDLYWPGMNADVDDYIRTCDTCQRFKNPKTPPFGLLQPIPSSELGQRLHIDIVGPMTQTSNGNLYIITAIDAFSRFGYARAASRMRSEDIEKFINEEIVTKHGPPKAIASDNGKQLVSKLIRDFMGKYGIKAFNTCPYWPQANGMDERFNGTLVKILRCYTSCHQLDWDKHLLWALYNYNITINDSTKYSPYILMYGFQPRHPLKNPIEIDPDELLPMLLDTRDAIRKSAESNIIEAQRIYKYYYDLKHQEQDFKIGDLVLYRVHAIPSHLCKKLAHRWAGPYVVVKFIVKDDRNVAVLIGDFVDFSIKRASFGELKHYHIRKDNREGEVEEDIVTHFARLYGDPPPAPVPYEHSPDPDQVRDVIEGRVIGETSATTKFTLSKEEHGANRSHTPSGSDPIMQPHNVDTNNSSIDPAYDNRWQVPRDEASIRPTDDLSPVDHRDDTHEHVNRCWLPRGANSMFLPSVEPRAHIIVNNASTNQCPVLSDGISMHPTHDESPTGLITGASVSNDYECISAQPLNNNSHCTVDPINNDSASCGLEQRVETAVGQQQQSGHEENLQDDSYHHSATSERTTNDVPVQNQTAIVTDEENAIQLLDQDEIEVIVGSQDNRSLHGSSPASVHLPPASSTFREQPARYNLRRAAEIRLPTRYLDKH